MPIPAPAPDDGFPLPTPHRWTRGKCPPLVHVPLGDHHMIFNPMSGHTHWINELVVDILEILALHPMDGRELMTAMQLDPAEDSTLAEMERILNELDRLGLIFPVAS